MLRSVRYLCVAGVLIGMMTIGIWGCKVSVGPGAGGGVAVGFTLGGKSYVVELGGAGVFDITAAGQPVRSAVAVELFTQTPTDSPSGAEFSVAAADVQILALPGAAKGQYSASEAAPDGTSVQVRAFIAPGTSTDPCANGSLAMEFELRQESGRTVMYQNDEAVDVKALFRVAADKLYLIEWGAFSLCLEVSSDQPPTRVVINKFGVSYIDGEGSDNGNANENDNGNVNDNQNANDNGNTNANDNGINDPSVLEGCWLVAPTGGAVPTGEDVNFRGFIYQFGPTGDLDKVWLDMDVQDEEGTTRFTVEIVRFNSPNVGPMAGYANVGQGVDVEDGEALVSFGFTSDEGESQTYLLLEDVILSGNPPNSFQNAHVTGTFQNDPVDANADGTRMSYCPSGENAFAEEDWDEELTEALNDACGAGTGMFVPVIFLFCGLARFHRHR
ncbi:MAG: hypothetical protein JXB13_00960 [Phycisphaerae bacterium]|nr:hypothetical protein [Phycisphaerae bacterium]